MDSIAQAVKPSLVPATSVELSFMPYIHALRASQREQAKTRYPEQPDFVIFSDYSFYVVINLSKDESIMGNFSKMPYFRESDARAAMEEQKLLNVEDKLAIGHGYFSLDNPIMARHVNHFDTVSIDSIDNPYVKAWLSDHRHSYAKRYQKDTAMIKPLDWLDYNNPIENCPEFLKRAAYRESPEYTADLHYFSVQVEHREVAAGGFGGALFFYLKDAIAYKNLKEKEYPNCRFCIDSGGLLSYARAEEALNGGTDENHYVAAWRLQHLSRLQAQSAGKMEASLS